MTLFDLTGKVAVITGSTKGIGRAIAEQMALHGARVVVSSRKADACVNVSAEINTLVAGQVGEAMGIAANISRKEDLENLVAKTREVWGKIDILVCNAAANPYYGSMLDISDQQFEKIMDNNIKSNHWLSAMVIPEMQARKDGVIIIISSIGGVVGHTTLGAYGLSKAADMALARNIGAEFGGDNIRANAIAPGLIKTDFAKTLWDNPEYLQKATASCPLSRIGEPNEIAGATVFLASAAGAFMNGQTLIIDGGRTMSN
ncbi:short-chain dehydrogenase [Gammaproteobacteria bacterium 53_120_T64]|nr:short-chain dehydrogenase [Gammaproteobacteria bacterium 53_120_T64]